MKYLSLFHPFTCLYSGILTRIETRINGRGGADLLNRYSGILTRIELE